MEKVKETAIKLCHAFILMMLGINLHAQNYTYKPRFTVSKSHFADTIPIEFEDDQIYIRAFTRDSEYRFCLDTGSSQGIVYADSPLPYTRKLGKIVSHDANGATSHIDVVEYPDFRIGGITIHGYAGSLIDSHIPHDGYDAVLGFDLVNKGLSMKIDTEKGFLVLTDNSRHFDGEGGFALKYRLPRWVPLVRISPFDDCTDEARFDTGSRRLYVMSGKSRREFSAEHEEFGTQIEGLSFGSRSIGSFGAEQPDEVAFLRLDRLKWGEFTFSDYHTMTTQGTSRIGAELLRYGSVVFLPKRKAIVFQPYGGHNSCSVGNKQMEIAFIPHDGRATVGLIWEGSKQYKSGFRQGDAILSIDGRPIGSFGQFLSYPFINGRQHVFMVRGADGRLREVRSER